MFHRAGECDVSGVHEEDLVYVVDGVQAVSDDDLGGVRGKLGQNLFEQLLGDGVDVGGGFVEDQQLGLRSVARMKAISCFWPRLMLLPLLATFVSRPSEKRESRLG